VVEVRRNRVDPASEVDVVREKNALIILESLGNGQLQTEIALQGVNIPLLLQLLNYLNLLLLILALVQREQVGIILIVVVLDWDLSDPPALLPDSLDDSQYLLIDPPSSLRNNVKRLKELAQIRVLQTPFLLLIFMNSHQVGWPLIIASYFIVLPVCWLIYHRKAPIKMQKQRVLRGNPLVQADEKVLIDI